MLRVEKKFLLRPVQAQFLKSEAKYTAFIGGWGTGKSLTAILKILKLTTIPNNLLLIARKNFTDLRDSTIRDFERYTGLKVNKADKQVMIKNSLILFRHADEFSVLQNINLGAFWIEQAEEIEDQRVFDFLCGRLRRNLKNYGIITANATDENHWIYKLFKASSDPDFALFEMSTLDNTKNLPQDFIHSVVKLKDRDPEIYERYVLNNWGISDSAFLVIRRNEIDALPPDLFCPTTKKLIAVDPATGGDECVILVFNNTRIIDSAYLKETDTMKITGYISLLAQKHTTPNIAIDVVGIGKGIADRLAEMKYNVIYLQSAERSKYQQFLNKRAEMWWYVREQIKNKQVVKIEDEETKRQLSIVKYAMDSSGNIKIERKEEIKKRIGRSPDRGDCYVYGIYALQFVTPVRKAGVGYEDKEEENIEGSWMDV